MDLHASTHDDEDKMEDPSSKTDRKVGDLGRQETIFKDQAYVSAEEQKKFNMKDINIKSSPFYVR